MTDPCGARVEREDGMPVICVRPKGHTTMHESAEGSYWLNDNAPRVEHVDVPLGSGDLHPIARHLARSRRSTIVLLELRRDGDTMRGEECVIMRAQDGPRSVAECLVAALREMLRRAELQLAEMETGMKADPSDNT